jgi:hypothetical protein
VHRCRQLTAAWWRRRARDRAGEPGDDDGISHLLAGIGAVEESEPLRQLRIKVSSRALSFSSHHILFSPLRFAHVSQSSIQIDLHIGPRPSLNGVVVAPQKTQRPSAPGEGKARPNKKRRQALARKIHVPDAGNAVGGVGDQEMDEEMMMNLAAEEEEQGVGVGVGAGVDVRGGAIKQDIGMSALGESDEEEEVEEIE